jgi:transposase-like protein
MVPNVCCPTPSCRDRCQLHSNSINLNGTYFRKRDGRNVSMYFCRACRKHFSDATSETIYRQKRPDINERVRYQLMSGTSERRTAKLLGVNRKTIARRVVFLGIEAQKAHQMNLTERPKVKYVVTDEMETFEHTKCKPLSIPLVVEARSRRILSIGVAVMPAKGPLARVSRARYGFRRDDRIGVMEKMFRDTAPFLEPKVHIRSDKCPRYPSVIQKTLPGAKHLTFLSRRGCVVGYGELKATGHDPLFSLNHTAAMFRDNIKRLARRTWCTTKRPERLRHLLWIYVVFHNRFLIGGKAKIRGIEQRV